MLGTPIIIPGPMLISSVMPLSFAACRSPVCMRRMARRHEQGTVLSRFLGTALYRCGLIVHNKVALSLSITLTRCIVSKPSTCLAYGELE